MGLRREQNLNQQRGRRYRSAKIIEDAIKKAERNGETLPAQDPFDSNCITPGTEFMTKLDEQLKYFIAKKISTDILWQNCTVIYSGHKTPGEGEHKIMDYIRYCRSQDNYDPHTRHCLYGLDADLIMLGLTSHEPHFSLLREEIIYGKKVSRIQAPEEITFFLFQLSLLREYLNLEFASLRNLPFGYDIECIIDDVVLLGFLVGNDFIPNLPELHINKDGLSLLFNTYKQCLPKLNGYINEKGALNFKRFDSFMQHLSEIEIEKFRDHNDDLKYLENKRRMTSTETDNSDDDCFSNEARNTLERIGATSQPEFFSDPDYSDLPEEEQIFRYEFKQHKHNYYRSKFNFVSVDDHVIKEIAVHYVTGIQWILNYYFNGIGSWSWFYPFHYSPYISDVTNFSNEEITFEIGTAFLPYQQLLAVLPPYSVSLVPKTYHDLMLMDCSPLANFYPKTFQTDMNGKIQEWEAVVLIPFIDETRLLEAMDACNANLLEEERERNKHGHQFLYTYSSESLGIYKAPDYFPVVTANHAAVREESKDAWFLKQSDVFKGLHAKVDLDLHFSGFPTLRHLDHTFRVSKEDIKVFQQSSRNESIILQISPSETETLNKVAEEFLNKSIYVSWPHLIEAKVVALRDGKMRYQLTDEMLTAFELSAQEEDFWFKEEKDLSNTLLKRWGIDVGNTSILVDCKSICGLRYRCTREGEVTLEKQWSNLITTFPWQLTVKNIRAYNPRYKVYRNVEELFTVETKVFMLGIPYYGSMGIVKKIMLESGRISVEMIVHEEPNFNEAKKNFYNIQDSYLSAQEASARLNLSPKLFSRLTGTILVSPAARLQPFQKDQKYVNKTNIGMNLKNNVRGEEVTGYTRKDGNLWLYSELCIKHVENYLDRFPEVFTFANNNETMGTIYQDEIFAEDWQENFNKLKVYLDEAPFNKAERKKCISTILDPASMILAETEVKKYAQIAAKSLNMQVRPHLLFLPNSLQGSSPPDSTVTFEILDRVVNVREGYSVPLGARGTIIGIRPTNKDINTLYDVIFDDKFSGGTDLLVPISAGRCCRMYCSAIINLSHNDRKTGKECSFPRKKFINQTTGHDYRPAQARGNAYDSSSWRDDSAAYKMTTYNKPSILQRGQRNLYAQSVDTNNYQRNWRTTPAQPLYTNNRQRDTRTTYGQDTINRQRDTSTTYSQDTTNRQRDSTINVQNADNSYHQGERTSTFAQNAGKNQQGEWRTTYTQNADNQDDRNMTSQMADSTQHDQRGNRKQLNEEGMDSINAPAACSLPSPFQFASASLKSIQVLPNKKTAAPPPKQISKYVKKNDLGKQIDVRGIDYLVHGTYFINWKSIKEEGLGSDGDFVQCVNYLPNFFQLLIYLDIKQLLQDGYKFMEHVNNEILCSTNHRGKIPLQYIEKAYDNRNDVLIYVSPTCRTENLNLPDINRILKSKGRGQAMKEFREEQEKDNPLALSRRIARNLESLPSISKEPIILTGMKHLFNNENEYPIKNPVQTEQLEQHENEQNQFSIDLNEINFPLLSAQVKPIEVIKQKTQEKLSEKHNNRSTIDINEHNIPALENIFVPTQVMRSSVKQLPKTEISSDHVETHVSPKRASTQNDEAAKKDKSQTVQSKTKATKSETKRKSRLLANFDFDK